MICVKCGEEYGDKQDRCSCCHTPNHEKIIKDLINSKWIIRRGPEECSKERGFYMVYGDFDMDEEYLKVGIATWGNKKNGLKRRIRTHYNSRFKPSVLARHLSKDHTFSKKFNLDLTEQSDRKIFLKERCYFKILPTSFLLDDELKPCEDKIENKLRDKIRYIDEVVER